MTSEYLPEPEPEPKPKPAKAFWALGMAPDIHLHVLDRRVYHVHSAVLKLHSEFFLKFLNSAEKQAALDETTAEAEARGVVVTVPATTHWITLVDDDGSWSLIGSMDGKVSLSLPPQRLPISLSALYSNQGLT